MVFFDLVDIQTTRQDIYESKGSTILNKSQVIGGLVHCKNLTDARTHWNKQKAVMLKDYSLEPGLMREIASKGKLVILVPVSLLLYCKGIRRALLIRTLRNFLTYSVQVDLSCRLVSYTQQIDDVRTRRELVHVGCLLGLNVSQAKRMVGLPEEFVQKAN